MYAASAFPPAAAVAAPRPAPFLLVLALRGGGDLVLLVRLLGGLSAAVLLEGSDLLRVARRVAAAVALVLALLALRIKWRNFNINEYIPAIYNYGKMK